LAQKGNRILERLMGVAEVATLLNISQWTVRKFVQEGRLQTVNVLRGKMLFRVDDVEAFLNQAAPAPSGR
jgi:excisionase family DNA binding protein